MTSNKYKIYICDFNKAESLYEGKSMTFYRFHKYSDIYS